MRYLPLILLVLLSGCPGGSKPGTTPQAKQHSSTPKLKITLLRTDLGVGDGDLVRDADTALHDLEAKGGIDYLGVGELPGKLVDEGGANDIGLPLAEMPAGSNIVGTMPPAQAMTLAQQIPDSDIVIVSGPISARPVFKRIASGKLKAKLLIVLDTEGPNLPAPPAGTDVVTFQYDVKEAAYLLGVAAGVSSRSQAFAMFTSTFDPNAATLVKTFTNGVHNRMTGGRVYHAEVMPDDDNIVPPPDFTKAFESIMVPGRQLDHLIVFCGRATPSMMFALSSKPTDGYLLGGYGDFTQVRPARVVGCIVKHPGVGLKKVLEGATSLAEVKKRLGNGLTLTFKEGGVDVTDFNAYANYNQDADDIADAVKEVRSEIEGGEVDVLQ